MASLSRTLLDAGLLHGDILTAGARRFLALCDGAEADGETLAWEDAPRSLDLDEMLRPPATRSSPTAGCGW